MTRPDPVKFFVNSGIVSSRADIHTLLRPLAKQAISYHYFRGRDLITSGTGFVDRVVIDEPDTSTVFTPVSICLNVDSFEHLEFETRPDQLLAFSLVQGDERIVIEFASLGDGPAGPEAAGLRAPGQLAFDTSGFVQMQLLGPDAGETA